MCEREGGKGGILRGKKGGGGEREGGGEIGDILVKYFLPNVLVTCCFGNRCDQSPIKLEWDNFKVNNCTIFNKMILFESF